MNDCSESLRPNRLVASLVITWVLMIPLFYFASAGTIWIDTAKGNDPLSERFSSFIVVSRSAISYVIELLTFFIIAVAAAPRLAGILRELRRNRPILLLTTLAMVSVFWSQFPKVTLQATIQLGLATALAYFLYSKFQDIEQLELVWILGAICLALSIYFVLFSPEHGIDHSGSSAGGWQGMYGQKNTCAMMTVFMLTAVLYSRPRNMLARIARVFYISLSVFLVSMTDSTSGQILFSVLLIYYLTMKCIFLFKGTRRLVVAMLITVFISLLAVLATSNLAKLTQSLGKDPTFTGRTLIWAAAMVSVLKRPLLGYGYSAFWRAFQGEAANVSLMNGWSSVYAHSGYVDILTTLGGVGLLLFLVSAAVACRNAGRLMQKQWTPLMEWSLCVVLLTLVINISEVTILRSAHLLWLLYLLAYINLAAATRRNIASATHYVSSVAHAS